MFDISTIHPSPAITEKQIPWSMVELFKPMWHEAGHAVVARLTGFPVAWVSVDQNFIKKDPLAIKNGSNNSPAVCMTISSDRMEPIQNRRSAMNKDAKETVIGYCMHVLAGPSVECRVDPEHFNADLSANDYGQVSWVLALVEPNEGCVPGRGVIPTLARAEWSLA